MLPVYIFAGFRTTYVSDALKINGRGRFYFSVYMSVMALILIVSSGLQSNEGLDRISYLRDNPALYTGMLSAGAALSAFALFVFSSKITGFISDSFTLIRKMIDRRDIIFMSLMMLFSISLIIIFYTQTRGAYDYNNLVYDMDSLYVCKCYYPDLLYGAGFDNDLGIGGLRHTLATLAMYPVFSILFIPSTLFGAIVSLGPAMYAVSNAFFLVIATFLLSRLVNSRWVYLVAACSNPFIIYSVFLEKYQITVLMWVLFTMLVHKNADERLKRMSLTAGAGMMITGALMGLAISKTSNLRERINSYLKAIGYFAAVFIGSGRIGYLLDIRSLVASNYSIFFTPHVSTLTPWGRLCEYSNFLASCFISVPHKAIYEEGWTYHMIWDNETGYFNPVSIIIAALLIAAFIRFRKTSYACIGILWMLWSIIQHFQASLSSTFSLCFWWVIVPLIVEVINSVLKKKWQQAAFYAPVCAVMLFINLSEIKDILTLLKFVAPL